MCDSSKDLTGGGALVCNLPGVGHDLHYDEIDDVTWRDGRADD